MYQVPQKKFDGVHPIEAAQNFSGAAIRSRRSLAIERHPEIGFLGKICRPEHKYLYPSTTKSQPFQAKIEIPKNVFGDAYIFSDAPCGNLDEFKAMPRQSGFSVSAIAMTENSRLAEKGLVFWGESREYIGLISHLSGLDYNFVNMVYHERLNGEPVLVMDGDLKLHRKSYSFKLHGCNLVREKKDIMADFAFSIENPQKITVKFLAELAENHRTLEGWLVQQFEMMSAALSRFVPKSMEKKIVFALYRE